MEEIEDTKQLDKKTVEPIPPNQTKHATNLNLFTLICIHHGRLGSIGNDLQPHGSTCSGIGYCPGSVWEPNCIVLGADNQVQKVAPGGQICTKRVLSCSLWPWDPRNSRGATWQHNSVRSHKWVNFPAAEQSQPQATELQSMSNSLRTKQWQFLVVPFYLGCASVW